MHADADVVVSFEAESRALAAELLRDFMTPPPRLTVSEWAAKHRHLGPSESAEPGPYRIERTPYAREPQDCMSARSTVEEVVLMWAAQTSKTTVMLNCLGASIGTNPGPIMIVWPTNTVAKRNSRQRIAPLLNESPQLAEKVASNRSRDKANTTLLKEFDGGILVIAGANSAADLRSTPVRDLYLDEIDNFPLDVDGEGDPSKLAEARQTTFARKKRLKSSTPTTKDFSRIEAAYLASDRCRFHVACPHCGAYQALEFGADQHRGLKWDKDEAGAPVPSSVRYVCAAHGCEIREHHKRAMLAGGVWVADQPGARGGKVRGFHLNGLYSPLGWLSWREIAREWFEAMQAVAKGDVSLLRVFVNTRLAETFEEQGDRADQHALRKRAGEWELRTVIVGCVLTLGVDVQRDRVEARLYSWARGMERQLVDRAVFYGDPTRAESDPGSPWAKLTEYRRTPVHNLGGATVPLLATMVDSSDGHSTQAVYVYCRQHQAESVLAIKGASTPGKPIVDKPKDQEVNWRGQKITKGVKLWPIGTDTAKAEIYGRLRVVTPGPGYVHLSKHLPADEFEQITSERIVTRYVKGRPRLEWILPPGRRNEGLDCAVYALAAAHWIGIDRWKDGDWERREALVRPVAAAAQPAKPKGAEVVAEGLAPKITGLANMARFQRAGR
jgi:phage terminase large subunit GpA-like protein